MSFSKLDALASVAELIGGSDELVSSHAQKWDAGSFKPGRKKESSNGEAGGFTAIHEMTVVYGPPDEQVFACAARSNHITPSQYHFGEVSSIPRQVAARLALPIMSRKAPQSFPKASNGPRDDAAHGLSLSEPGDPSSSPHVKRTSAFVTNTGEDRAADWPVHVPKRPKLTSAGSYSMLQSYNVNGVITAASPVTADFAGAQPARFVVRATSFSACRRPSMQPPTAAASGTAIETAARPMHPRTRDSPVVSVASDDPCMSSDAIIGSAPAAATATLNAAAGLGAARALSDNAARPAAAVVSPVPTSGPWQRTALGCPTSARGGHGYRTSGLTVPEAMTPVAPTQRGQTSQSDAAVEASAAAAAAGGTDAGNAAIAAARAILEGSVAVTAVADKGAPPRWADPALDIARLAQSPSIGGPDVLEKMRIAHQLLMQREQLGPDLVNWVLQQLKDLCQSAPMEDLVAQMAAAVAAAPKKSEVPPPTKAATRSPARMQQQQQQRHKQHPVDGAGAGADDPTIHCFAATHRALSAAYPPVVMAAAGMGGGPVVSPRSSPANSGSTAAAGAKQLVMSHGRGPGSSPPAELERAGATTTATEDPTPARGARGEGVGCSGRKDCMALGVGGIGTEDASDGDGGAFRRDAGAARGERQRGGLGGARGGPARCQAPFGFSPSADDIQHSQPQSWKRLAQDLGEVNGSTTSSSSSSSRTAAHAKEPPPRPATGGGLTSGAGPREQLRLPRQEAWAAAAGPRTGVGSCGGGLASRGVEGHDPTGPAHGNLDSCTSRDPKSHPGGGTFAILGQAAPPPLVLDRLSHSQVQFPALLHGDSRGLLSLHDSIDLNNATGMLGFSSSGQLPSRSAVRGMEVDPNHRQQQQQQLAELLMAAGVKLRHGLATSASRRSSTDEVLALAHPTGQHSGLRQPSHPHQSQQQLQHEQQQQPLNFHDGAVAAAAVMPPLMFRGPSREAAATMLAPAAEVAGQEEMGGFASATTAALIAALIQRGQTMGSSQHKASEGPMAAAAEVTDLGGAVPGAAVPVEGVVKQQQAAMTGHPSSVGRDPEFGHPRHLAGLGVRPPDIPAVVRVSGIPVGPTSFQPTAGSQESWGLCVSPEAHGPCKAAERVLGRSDAACAGASGHHAVGLQVARRNRPSPQQQPQPPVILSFKAPAAAASAAATGSLGPPSGWGAAAANGGTSGRRVGPGVADYQPQPAGGYDGRAGEGPDALPTVRLQRQGSLPSAGSYSFVPPHLVQMVAEPSMALGSVSGPRRGPGAYDFGLRDGVAAHGLYPLSTAFTYAGEPCVGRRRAPPTEGKAAALMHG